MLIRSLPATAGLTWLREGWQLFRRQPLGLPAMVVIYMMVALLPLVLGVPGMALAGVLNPFVTIGLMLACKEVAAGRAPNAVVFARPFQDARQRVALLRLGLLNAALWLTVAVLSNLLGPELPDSASAPSSLQDIPVTALLAQLMFAAPVIAMMWFAPLLAGWHGATPAKAMFGSAVAVLRNLGALLVFGVAVFALAAGVSLAVVSVVSLVVASREVLTFVLAPLALILTTIVQASFYPMYRSVFGDTAATPVTSA